MGQREVMVVEPDRHAREALQNVFIRKGWEVVVVTTLADALAVLRDYDPSWVIASAALPDDGSKALFRYLRGEKKQSRIALLAASTRATSDPEPDLVLRKPVRSEEAYHRCDGFGKPVSSGPAPPN